MRGTGRAALAFVLCVPPALSLAACRDRRHDETTRVEVGPSESAPGYVSGPSVHRAVPLSLPCRAVTIDGDVRTGAAGSPLSARAEIPLEGWLSLAPSARVVAKDPRTTRETTFRGPARARACVDTLEESWLASGTFQSASAAGEVPGSEEWVVTPLGVVRFGAATLRVEVSSAGVRAGLGGGVAFVWLARDASMRDAEGGIAANPTEDANPDEGWARVSGGTVTLVSSGARAPLEAARSSVDDCARLGKKARELATVLLTGGADGTIVSRQVLTRRLARGACAVAALRLDLLSPSNERDKIAASLSACRGDWRTLPTVAR